MTRTRTYTTTPTLWGFIKLANQNCPKLNPLQKFRKLERHTQRGCTTGCRLLECWFLRLFSSQRGQVRGKRWEGKGIVQLEQNFPFSRVLVRNVGLEVTWF